MNENELAKWVYYTCYDIYKHLGPGLLESVYEEALCHELVRESITFDRQRRINVEYKGLILSRAFVADFIVENKLILEIKSVSKLEPVHYKQLLTYLRLTKLKLGLLINFNEVLFRNGVKRVVNGLEH